MVHKGYACVYRLGQLTQDLIHRGYYDRTRRKMNEERTHYIADKYDVSKNAARTIQLKELGFDAKECAEYLDVRHKTVAGYIHELSDKIHVDVFMPIWYKLEEGIRFDTYPREPDEHGPVPKELIDPEFREPELPRNKGVSIEDIDSEHITVRT